MNRKRIEACLRWGAALAVLIWLSPMVNAIGRWTWKGLALGTTGTIAVAFILFFGREGKSPTHRVNAPAADPDSQREPD